MAASAFVGAGILLYRHYSLPPGRTMRIGFGDDAPLHFRDSDGSPIGFSIDVLDEAARRAGIKLEWVYAPERPDAAFESNRVDLWPVIADAPERKGKIYFSEPWASSTYALTSRKDNPIMPGHAPPNVTIAREPSNIEKYVLLRNLPQAKAIEAQSHEDALDKVCTGEVDAVLTSEAFDEIGKRPLCENVPLVVSTLQDTVNFSIGANYRTPGATRAADVLREQMTAMAKDGSLTSIIFRWSYRTGAEISAFFNLLEARRHAQLLSGMVFLLGLVLALLGILAVRVAERTKALQQEVSDRERAEKALVRSEEDFRSLVENAPCGIYRCSFMQDRFLSVNPALANMLRYSTAEELLHLRLSWDLYVDPKEGDALIASAEQDEIVGRETEWRRKDGTRIKVRLVGRILREPKTGDAVAQFIAEDVTDRNVLEEQLRQAQKMDAVGRLAGGVAHDFNNILSIIMGHGELVLMRLESGDPARKRIEQIIEAAIRGSSLTEQLLTYGRKQVLKTEVFNVNTVLNDTARLLQRVIGEDIELLLRFHRSAGSINADRSRIEQILLNLAINSRDAMPNGGTLTLETRNVELGQEYCQHHPESATGSYVMFAVKDTGCGMGPEVLGHLFEPFYTTKERGKGTGLGLSTVYGIVKQSGGFITVRSEVGQGTTVEILLPRVPDVPAEPVLQSEEKQCARGCETVLIVEDESDLRQLAAEILEQLGYKVLTASDGAQAIRAAEAYAGGIDLLLTDVIMPGMNGWDLAVALRRSRASIKVLLMSGYTDGVIARRGVLEPGIFLLAKPFRSAELAARVREVLDARESLTPPLII